MSYAVKELFLTLQGEGVQSGSRAVFLRFAGCNLWSGREADRANAICRFCDTDFVGTGGDGGGRFTSAEVLAAAVESHWPAADRRHRFVVLTGGEPLLQVDAPLLDALRRRGFRIAVESNGTVSPPAGIDWLCVSPKAGAAIVARSGQELKLVFPQAGLDPADFAALSFDHFYLQPMDGPAARENTAGAVDYCRQHPQWGLSLQTHKLIGIR